jgi:hypothetical protein
MKDHEIIYYVLDNLAVILLNLVQRCPLEVIRLGQQIALLHIASLRTNSVL